MLVLTRKVGTGDGAVIQIGDGIAVTLISVQGGNGARPEVRLGIEAPTSVEIWRSELRQENSPPPVNSDLDASNRPPSRQASGV